MTMLPSKTSARHGAPRLIVLLALLLALGGPLGFMSTSVAQDATPAAEGANIATEPSEPLVAPPEGKTELIVGTAADVTTLDPQKSTQVNNIQITFNMYDNLLTRGRDLSLQPMLATDYTQVDDLTWEFNLREGVTFHNGDPFTAADVEFTIERTYSGEDGLNVASIFTTVEDVVVVDDLTVQFVTAAPDPLLPARLAFYGGQIMPMDYFNEVGPDGFNAAPVGTGPVQYVDFVPNDQLTLARYDEYWGEPIAFETVIFRPLPETSTRLAALEAGEVDIITRVPPDLAQDVADQENARIEAVEYAGVYGLAVNWERAPLDDPLIKQALSLAIDRETIIEELYAGYGTVPSQPAVPGDFAYDPDLPAYEYNPERAMELLEEAGYDGTPIVIQTTDGYIANDRIMAEAIASMWEAIGVTVDLQVIEISVRSELNTARAFEGLWWTDPTSVLGDPDGMMFRLLGPGGSQQYWIDEEWIALGQEARTSLDPERRAEIYAEMFQIFNENLPWILIVQPFEIYGVANYIDWYPYANQLFNLRAENLQLADA